MRPTRRGFMLFGGAAVLPGVLPAALAAPAEPDPVADLMRAIAAVRHAGKPHTLVSLQRYMVGVQFSMCDRRAFNPDFEFRDDLDAVYASARRAFPDAIIVSDFHETVQSGAIRRYNDGDPVAVKGMDNVTWHADGTITRTYRELVPGPRPQDCDVAETEERVEGGGGPVRFVLLRRENITLR